MEYMRDVTPTGFNARTRVHEYGGGDYTVADGTIVFSNFADQRLYRQSIGARAAAVNAQCDTALRRRPDRSARIRFSACAKIIRGQAKRSIRSFVSILTMETPAR